MQQIFKNVYVSSIDNLNGPVDNDIILLTDYNTMITNEYDGNEVEFFNNLMQRTERTTIYGHYDQLKFVLIPWLKSTLKHISKNTASTILDDIVFHDLYDPDSLDNEDNKFPFDVKLWNTSKRFEIVDKFDNSPIEFIISTLMWVRLSGRHWQYKTQGEARVVDFIKRRVVELFVEWRDVFLIPRLYYAKEILGIDVDITDISQHSLLMADQKYKWLIDTNFTADNYQYVWNQYDIHQLFIDVNVFVTRLNPNIIPDDTRLKHYIFKNDVKCDDVFSFQEEWPEMWKAPIFESTNNDLEINGAVLWKVFNWQADGSGNFAFVKELSLI